MVTLPFPVRADGSQTVTLLTRGHDRPPYTPADLRTLEVVGARFAAELEDIPIGGVLQPRALRPAEHEIALGTDMKPTEFPLFAQALLAVFYGPLGKDSDGRPRLPVDLAAQIINHRSSSSSVYHPGEPGEFHFAFTKAHRGRVLCLTVQSADPSGYRLICHEDSSKHDRLRRLKKSCWADLARDRHTVFRVALALLDEVRDPEEIIRRAGLTAHKPSSTVRIISRARGIVAAL